jgi:hypothetical protein
MTGDPDPAGIARAIIDANLYMVLGTADADGRPWVSPVYYAPAGYGQFLWVSSPEATHSRNVAGRPDVSIVIFDSSAPINTGQGVYMSAIAHELSGDDREKGLETFSRRSLAHGAGEWTLEDVQPPARLRLYGATAVEQYVLGEGDRRVRVTGV